MLGGFMVMSPSAAFLAFCLTALLSAIPAVFGTGKTRLIAAALLLGSVVLAVNRYADFRREQERYRQRKPTASQRADGALVA